MCLAIHTHVSCRYQILSQISRSHKPSRPWDRTPNLPKQPPISRRCSDSIPRVPVASPPQLLPLLPRPGSCCQLRRSDVGAPSGSTRRRTNARAGARGRPELALCSCGYGLIFPCRCRDRLGGASTERGTGRGVLPERKRGASPSTSGQHGPGISDETVPTWEPSARPLA